MIICTYKVQVLKKKERLESMALNGLYVNPFSEFCYTWEKDVNVLLQIKTYIG